MVTLTLHNDLPTLDDKLEWAHELDRLCQRIQGCGTPHVLGIHGDWGSGKTSFMRQLQCRLGGEMPDDGSVADWKKFEHSEVQKQLQKKIITIWFDAWRYQNEPVPVVALLHEMRKQMALLPTVVGKIGKTVDITVRYALNGLADVAKVIGLEGIPSAEKIQRLGENWEREHNAQALTSDTIRKHLQEAIKCLLPKGESARVVVFIDDLDRCNPKTAIRLLEGLKIYLSIPKCVFVLGTNERMLVDAIREEISAPAGTSSEELKLRAAHYFEKICTDIYRLPLPAKTLELFSGWLPSKVHREALQSALGNKVCLPPNPRRLKALANQWERFARCTSFPRDTEERKILAVRVLVAAYVHQFHRDLWERWHFDPDFWAEFVAWCNGERSRNADGQPADPPKWATALKLTGRKEQDTWIPDFLNPGDIDIFWMGALIQEYSHQLVAKDFTSLLQGRQQNTSTAA